MRWAKSRGPQCSAGALEFLAKFLQEISRYSVISTSGYQTLDVLANIEFRVPYSQWYLFNTIPDTNHNANPTNPNCNSKGNSNPTNPINPNARYR